MIASGSASDHDWKTALRRDGYAIFRDLVPIGLISAARRVIDEDLQKNYDSSRQVEYDNQSYCPGIRDSRVITDLVKKSPVRALIDEALGWHSVDVWPGQIALRRARSAKQAALPTPHIDGIPSPVNGVPGKEISNFTALVGVYLSEVKQEFAGNFTVWPGSHHLLEQYFRSRGPAAVAEGMPKIPLGQPVQLTCSPGDVVLCHYQLAHAGAANTSDHDRYAVYFRVCFKNIQKRRWELLTNIWNGWRI